MRKEFEFGEKSGGFMRIESEFVFGVDFSERGVLVGVEEEVGMVLVG